MSTLLKSEQVAARLRELAAARVDLNPADVHLDSRFSEDLGFDSLDQVEFAMEVEEEFDVRLADAEVEQVGTVRDVLALLVRGRP